MAILATGSVAFDYILTFEGRFRDHIMPEQAHILNLSFLVKSLEKRRGGVAANYAYNLALMGCPAAILATAGPDAASFKEWLQSRGIDCSGLVLLEDEITATGFSTTDLDDNQIWGYYGGAMLKAGRLGLADSAAAVDAVIVGPNAPDAMLRLAQECRDRGLPWVFDPAHQLPHLEAGDLEAAARGAWILIGNDYEMELLRQRTGRTKESLLELSQLVVTTLGRKGSRIHSHQGTIEIPSAPAAQELDPTGAGDAYRAGLIAALRRGLSLEDAGRVASLAATYVVEQVGTIEHAYTLEQFARRYQEAFGKELPPALSAAPTA